VYKPPSVIQTSESLESDELVLLLLKNIVEVSSEKLVVDWWSNQFEGKDGKEDRRRRSDFSGGAFCTVTCTETGRGRRSIVSEKVDLGGVSSMARDEVSDDCLRSRFVNARNPDLKKEYPRKGFRSCMM
jgi:hypothetical protein